MKGCVPSVGFSQRWRFVTVGNRERRAAVRANFLACHADALAAWARGVGLGWVSILEPETICKALDVPGDWRFIGYLGLGYPRESSDPPELEREGWARRQPPIVIER